MADFSDAASSVDTQVVDQSSTTTQEPSPIDINDDALIRVKGSDKPVKFGDHVRGFQSQFTKASQEAARFKRELEAERQQRQQYEQERSRYQQNQPGQNQDPFGQVEALPYLSGKDAAQLLRQERGQLQQTNQVLIAALKKMQAMEATLGTLNSSHTSSAFNGKISNWLQEGGYPPEAADLAKEIYLAYEGDDLDNEFPQIFKNRFDQMERIFTARRDAKVRANRPQPFVPGRGGMASPSKPLEVKPESNARELADQLFGLFGETGT